MIVVNHLTKWLASHPASCPNGFQSGFKDEASFIPERVLLDVRSDNEWTGANPMGTNRGGHIPGAVHLEWNTTVDSTTKKFKPAAELRAMFAGVGLRPDKKVVAY